MTNPDPLRAAHEFSAIADELKDRLQLRYTAPTKDGSRCHLVEIHLIDLAEQALRRAALASIPAPAPIPPAPTVWYQCSACRWASAMGPDCERPKDCSNCGVTYMTGPGARGPWLSGPWAVDPRTLVPPASPEWLQTLIGHLRAREAIDHDEVSGRAADALSRCVVPALDRREVVARKLHELEHSFGFDPDHWNRLTVGEQAQYRTNADAILAALKSPGGEVMAELLNCPFCECADDLQVTVGCVVCGHCGATGPGDFRKQEGSIAAWNRRAPTIEAQDGSPGASSNLGAQVGPAAERPTLSLGDVGELVAEMDRAILGLNLLTSYGEDNVWRPADKARSALINARDALERLAHPFKDPQ